MMNTKTEGIISVDDLININISEVILNLSKRIENINKIYKYSQFEYDWNLNGAEPFSKELIRIAWEKINRLEKQPNVFPTACGSIQFEYSGDDGNYLEFEIYEDRIEMFKIINKTEFEKTLSISEDLNEIINEFKQNRTSNIRGE